MVITLKIHRTYWASCWLGSIRIVRVRILKLQNPKHCHLNKIYIYISADPCLRQGRGGAWDRRRREACRWLCTGFALAIADWACHRFFGRLGHKVIGLTACNPDVWLPSNPSRQGTAATGCRLWHNGLFFTGFQSGRLAALKPFPAGYGCHWLC